MTKVFERFIVHRPYRWGALITCDLDYRSPSSEKHQIIVAKYPQKSFLVIPVQYAIWQHTSNQYSFNLPISLFTSGSVDTGHADFGLEVESVSRVIDGAVVLIDSVEGVEAQTKGVWKQLDRYGVPTRMMFSNKQDRPVASFKFFLRSLLKNRLQRHPMDYLHAEPGIQGLVDLVKWKLWRWDEDGNPTCYPLPTDVNALVALKFLLSNHPIIPHLAPARTQLLENLSMFSEDLMETLLTIPSEPSSYLGVHHSDIIPHIRKNTFENKILPVVCGLAINHIRTSLAMDYDGELSASPVDDLHDPAPLRMLASQLGS
ncbi:P-loop containing nucleoside triphosphate hydrolase protein [Lentinula raphanica]|uniref:P-loop containing nucleoside triphosphate hydrolase protein n=1 Tax=Lentinula raphanica TaxID=153919 RepID=A0AA38NV84_9AGAR|nr:P-loop containing nucleoside triphosphate hydrolase protein [Lentinula raphanica]